MVLKILAEVTRILILKQHKVPCLGMYWPCFYGEPVLFLHELGLSPRSPLVPACYSCSLTIEFQKYFCFSSYTRDAGSSTVHVFEMPSMPYLKEGSFYIFATQQILLDL